MVNEIKIKGANAIFIEDSMFTTIIPLIPTVKENDIEENLKKTPVKTPVEILFLLKDNPDLTVRELAIKTEKSESAVGRAVRKLCKSKYLKRIGPDKGGRWKVMKNEQ